MRGWGYRAERSVHQHQPLLAVLRRGGGGGGADVDLALEQQVGVDFTVWGEADDEVAVGAWEVFVRVPPRIAEQLRRDVERGEILEAVGQPSVRDVEPLDRLADRLEALQRDRLPRLADSRQRPSDRREVIRRIPHRRDNRK